MKFAQRLLSEFNVVWGLDSYIGYRDLKESIKEIEQHSELDKRMERVDSFWRMLYRDLQLVSLVYRHLETEMLEKVTMLRQTPQEELRKEPIFDAFTHGRAILGYQELNREGFRCCLKKFQKRMGIRRETRSDTRTRTEAERQGTTEPGPAPLLPEDQAREQRAEAEHFEEQVEDAYFASPSKVDIPAEIEWLQSVYAEAFCDEAREVAEEVLDKVWSLDKRSHPRIIDYSDAHFFKQKQRKRESAFSCRIISGNSNRPLARSVTKCLGLARQGLTQAKVSKYVSGEARIEIQDNVRGDDVYIFQSGCQCIEDGEDVRTSLSSIQMELLLLIHTARLASAQRVTAVMPYLPYQTRNQPAAAFAQMIQQMGCDRLLTVDLQAGQVGGFYQIPVDNVTVVLEFAKYMRDRLEEQSPDSLDWAQQVCAISPTSTGVERAKQLADVLGCGIATVLRRRPKDLTEQGFSSEVKFTEKAEIVGEVRNKICIIMGCIIEDAEQFVATAVQLQDAGAARTYICAVHGLLVGEACVRLGDAPVEEVVVTDTVPQEAHMRDLPKLRVLPVAPLLSECIDRVHREESLGAVMKGALGARAPSPMRRQSPHGWDTRAGSRTPGPAAMEKEVERQLEGVDFTALQAVPSAQTSSEFPSMPTAEDGSDGDVVEISPRQCKRVREQMRDGDVPQFLDRPGSPAGDSPRRMRGSPMTQDPR